MFELDTMLMVHSNKLFSAIIWPSGITEVCQLNWSCAPFSTNVLLDDCTESDCHNLAFTPANVVMNVLA